MTSTILLLVHTLPIPIIIIAAIGLAIYVIKLEFNL